MIVSTYLESIPKKSMLKIESKLQDQFYQFLLQDYIQEKINQSYDLTHYIALNTLYSKGLLIFTNIDCSLVNMTLYFFES